MENLTFDTFTKKIFISAPKEKLYNCWATSQGLESWFLRKAVFTNLDGEIRKPMAPIQGGDAYIWEWYNWDGQETGEVLQVNGHDEIEMTFAGECKLLIHLEDRNDATLVTLQQSSIPTDEKSKMQIYTGCSNGWTFWLANLKAWLEHGILLNEKSHDLTIEPQAGHVFVNM